MFIQTLQAFAIAILLIPYSMPTAFASPQNPPPIKWIDIHCETRTGDFYALETKVLGFDPRDNMGRPVTAEKNGSELAASLLNSVIDPLSDRLYLEVVLDGERTAKTDRVLTIMASWMGDKGDPVFAQGVLVASLHDHQTGTVTDGPEERVDCQLEGL